MTTASSLAAAKAATVATAALGAVVPVIPTGAIVSAAAVVAWHAHTLYDLPLVFAVASLAALTGDVALYWLGSRGSGWSVPRFARADVPACLSIWRRLRSLAGRDLARGDLPAREDRAAG